MRMLSEMYGCTGGSLTFEDREWIAHQQMILGVNLIVPHLSLFSQTGLPQARLPAKYKLSAVVVESQFVC